ncbi:MAG: hypothetical protein ABI175_13620 [Polyangiales bacterium]
MVAILSAIGTYALTNSRYEVRTAGYLRQRSVADAISGLGAQAATSELGTAPAGYVGRLRATNATGEICQSNAGLGIVGPSGSLPPCLRIDLIDVEARTGKAMFDLYVPGTSGTPGMPGSLGLSPMNAGFWVELTDPVEVERPIAGEQIAGAKAPKFIDLTVTANGVVFQDEPGGVAGRVDANERPTATFTTGRGHIIVGPIYGSL